MELKLQNQVLESAMDFAPHELSTLANGELVAKLTRDAFAVGCFVSVIYPRLLTAVVMMVAAGIALHSRSTALCVAFVTFIPLAIAVFYPFARRFSENSHSVRTQSDKSYIALFDFFHTLPFLRTLDAERRFADAPRCSLRALNADNRSTDGLTIAFGALLGGILVVGTLKPQSGCVLINGMPIDEIDIGEFRRGIGVVFQDSLVVSGTLRDNITLRDPMFTAAEVRAASAASGLDAVVHKLHSRLDTPVGVGGQSLSGGECQRLAIARALVRKSGLMVLDEATNHLDADARAAFGRLLRQLVQGRIVLIVTHDDAIADMCDEKIFCQIPE